MAQTYEDIVRKWYNNKEFRLKYQKFLLSRFPKMHLEVAENLYQDTFYAIKENFMRGSIKENTSWNSYIMTIGLHLANKEMRKLGKTDSISATYDNGEEDDVPNKAARTVEDLLKTLPDKEELPFVKNPEAHAILGNEIAHTPEPCAKIIKLFYYEDLSMTEIAEEIGYKNAATAKAKKNQCMNDLINRIMKPLRQAGFDVVPKKWKRNGKN